METSNKELTHEANSLPILQYFNKAELEVSGKIIYVNFGPVFYRAIKMVPNKQQISGVISSSDISPNINPSFKIPPLLPFTFT